MTETEQRKPMFLYSTLGRRLVQEAAPKPPAADQQEQLPAPQHSSSSGGSVMLFLSVASLLGYLSYRNLRDL